MGKRIDKVLTRLDSASPPQLWTAACADYEVPFTWPMSLDTKRALLMKVTNAHDPDTAKWIAPTIPAMSDAVLDAQLQCFVHKYALPKPGKEPKVRGRKKSKWTFANEDEFYSFVELNKANLHHWGPRAVFKLYLDQHPLFDQRYSHPVKAVRLLKLVRQVSGLRARA